MDARNGINPSYDESPPLAFTFDGNLITSFPPVHFRLLIFVMAGEWRKERTER